MDTEKKKSMNSWSSRSIGKRWQHCFFYIVIRFAGRRVACLCMHFVTLWYVLFWPPLHKKCKPYLSRRFPNRKNSLSRLFDEYQWITSLGKVLIDRAAYGILGPKCVEIEVSQAFKLQFQELLNEGKGIIILSAHTACWQIAFSVLDFQDAKVYMLMHRDQEDVDKHYFEHDNRKPPFEIIDPAGYLGGTLQMASVLQDGHVLGLMGDRVFGDDSNTISVDFLGDPIKMPVAPYRLASMQGTPIAILLFHKVCRSKYRIEMPGIIRVPPGINRDSSAYLPYAQEFTKHLTEYVQEHPFDLYNFFQMWET
jgi:predicted LPLAT superfamily acyltransferase